MRLFLFRNNGYLAVTLEDSEFDRFELIDPMVLPGCQQDIIDRDIDELYLFVDDSTIFHHNNRLPSMKFSACEKRFLI